MNRADRFGLAQLYQLRGRVGRSQERAYAYLLVPPMKQLTDTARKRLKAIEQHTELGSGFHLAMKDLEIRGAGNLLGPQQHGFIEEVGFDLYCRLLEEAVAELKGEKIERDFEVKLELDCDAYVSEEYVEDSRQRVDIYRKISEAKIGRRSGCRGRRTGRSVWSVRDGSREPAGCYGHQAIGATMPHRQSQTSRFATDTRVRRRQICRPRNRSKICVWLRPTRWNSTLPRALLSRFLSRQMASAPSESQKAVANLALFRNLTYLWPGSFPQHRCKIRTYEEI